WDAATGRPLSPLLRTRDTILVARLSPDGRRVATGSGVNGGGDFVDLKGRGEARVWDVATGRAIGLPMRHRSAVADLAFSPDGQRVRTASDDGTARVWDATTGEPLTPVIRQDGELLAASFSPDGRLVATAGSDGEARVWDASTGEPATLPLRHGKAVQDVRF